VYNFTIPGYDRNPQARLTWSAAPPAGKLWLGLANWGLDRWDWYAASPAAPRNFSSLAPYIRPDGALLLAVLCLGAAPAALDTLRIGSEPPAGALQVTPQTAFVPFQATFDASASSDPDGTIAKYEWDLDGNGAFELDTGAVPSAPAQNYATAGIYPVALRVTDNDGLQNTMQLQVTAIAAWVHSWGGANSESLSAALYDGQGGLYFGGRTQSFGVGGSDCLLLKFNLAGELQWVRTWGTSDYDNVVDLALGADGNIIALAQTLNYYISCAIQHWTPDGALLDSTAILPYSDLSPKALAMLNSELYVVGHARVGVNSDAFVAKFGADNSLAWLKCWQGPIGSSFNDVVVHEGLAIGSSRIYAAGTTNNQALVFSCDTNGAAVAASTLNSISGATANAISVSGIIKLSIWVGATEFPVVGASTALLAQYASGYPVIMGWYGSDNTYTNDLIRTPGGGFDLAVDVGAASVQRGTLLGISSGGALNNSLTLDGAGQPYTLLGRCASLYGAGLLACGHCNTSDGAAWSAAGGSISSPGYTWSDMVMSEVDPGTVSAGAFPGTVSTPTGGTLDGAGGGGADALALVRLML
jgi:PKD repeat protein